MKPVFCGNFEYETRQSDLERAFSRYGRVDRVDMKSGFAFVYFEDERDADDAIRGLDNKPFGYSRRKLSVEWARQGERGSRHREGSKSMANQRPTKTLFVINFDPIHTRIRDIERHFDSYGKILHVRIRRNFAFVQFETQEEATKALECTHMTKILDRVVSVEYALRDDGERDRRDGGPRRGHGERSVSPYGRSRSPLYRKSRPSPDYGRGRSRPSPDYGRGRSRPSPDYGRARSPGYARSRSPGYGHPPSREYGRAPSRDNGRAPSPDYSHSRSPGYGPARSPVRSPGYGPARSPARSPGYDRAHSPDYDRAQSPSNGHAQSPGNGRVGSPDYVHSQSPVYADNDKHSPDFDKDRSRSPVRRSRS